MPFGVKHSRTIHRGTGLRRPYRRNSLSNPNCCLPISDGHVTGSVMAGYDGHRGWLYAVAVLKSHQRQGIGRALIQEAERRLAALGCSKINLQIRASNRGVTKFYAGLGYAVEDRVSMGKRI